ncbi:phosphatidylinositol 3,4,5-trisphosphate 3-phosphatase cnrN-like isoform X2 [Symsagittifera roscoffensis]|uniref:phosphatidylinositol 3,4,5-trisphosphate 3-phosphatase cnrN-like isoform X2 n=1 Tax=Symsagittifera roscoffensis TaxID=84072 RepID=UPI00307B2B8D
MDFFREAVSKNKKRFKEGNFNLDLSYVTSSFSSRCDVTLNCHETSEEPKLIAMGYPAKRIEASYRNRFEDVLRFLDERHPGHYKVFNLCTERKYALDSFGSRKDPDHSVAAKIVEEYGFADHKPPHFRSIHTFCQEVHDYLQQPHNVAVIHCKAGKGRTGVMICCYLIHMVLTEAGKSGWVEHEWRCRQNGTNPLSQLVLSTLDHFSRERTIDSKGVTIPSQRRYVELYAIYLHAVTIGSHNAQLGHYQPVADLYRTYRPLHAISLTHNSPYAYWSVELSFRLPHELPHHQENPFNFHCSRWAQTQCLYFNNQVVIAQLENIFTYSHSQVGNNCVHTWRASTTNGVFLLHEDFCVKFRRKDQTEFESWFNASFINESSRLCFSAPTTTNPSQTKFDYCYFSLIRGDSRKPSSPTLVQTNNSSSSSQTATSTHPYGPQWPSPTADKQMQIESNSRTQDTKTDLQLVLLRSHIDKIYKAKFDEKFDGCNITCQFGKEANLDRNTWRTFFTKWARPLQVPRATRGAAGVWNAIASTINGYSINKGPETALTLNNLNGSDCSVINGDIDTNDTNNNEDQRQTASQSNSRRTKVNNGNRSEGEGERTLIRMSRALSASQPNLLVAMESSSEQSGTDVQWQDSISGGGGIGSAGVGGGARRAIKREDSCEEKMKDIDDDEETDEDEEEERPMRKPLPSGGGYFIPTSNNAVHHYHRGDPLRSSEKIMSTGLLSNRSRPPTNMQSSLVPFHFSANSKPPISRRSCNPATNSRHLLNASNSPPKHFKEENPPHQGQTQPSVGKNVNNSKYPLLVANAHSRSHSIEDSAATAALNSQHALDGGQISMLQSEPRGMSGDSSGVNGRQKRAASTDNSLLSSQNVRASSVYTSRTPAPSQPNSAPHHRNTSGQNQGQSQTQDHPTTVNSINNDRQHTISQPVPNTAMQPSLHVQNPSYIYQNQNSEDIAVTLSSDMSDTQGELTEG